MFTRIMTILLSAWSFKDVFKDAGNDSEEAHHTPDDQRQTKVVG